MKQIILAILFLVSFGLQSFSPNKYVLVTFVTQSEDDKVLVTTIKTTLMNAEKVANMLNVNLVSEDVASDVFIFNIDSEEYQKLKMELFDEEGYEIVGTNEFIVSEGNNYKGLNIKSLEDGTYIFKLTNEEGKELTKTFKVE